MNDKIHSYHLENSKCLRNFVPGMGTKIKKYFLLYHTWVSWNFQMNFKISLIYAKMPAEILREGTLNLQIRLRNIAVVRVQGIADLTQEVRRCEAQLEECTS